MIPTIRFLSRNGMLNRRYGRLLVPLPVAAPLHRRRPALAHQRARLLRPWPRTGDRGQGPGRFRSLRLDRGRHQDPLPRGPGRDRRQDRDRSGMHDLCLPARADRPAVRDRRSGDVHRLRPRRGRSRAADPPAGHLQARRRSSAPTSGSATAPASCAASASATTRSSAPTRSSPRTSRPTRSSPASPPGSSACARRPSSCAGRTRSSRTRRPGPPCSRRTDHDHPKLCGSRLV